VAHLDLRSAKAAQRLTVCPVTTLDVDADGQLVVRDDAPAETLAYLVLTGLLARRVEIGGRTGVELLGRGDVLFSSAREVVPPQHAAHARDTWELLEPTRVAVLDRDFERTVMKWPGIVPRIFDRARQRVGTLAFQMALGQVPGVDRRLLVLLWLLADRWGTVTPDGVNLPLRISHRMLGELVAARRPSVTTALRTLADAGLIAPRRPSGWILIGDAPERLRAAASAERPARTLPRRFVSAG
jgi:DNA-binding transcriptional ArsR family regulator